jgi:hypothetical protein
MRMAVGQYNRLAFVRTMIRLQVTYVAGIFFNTVVAVRVSRLTLVACS